MKGCQMVMHIAPEYLFPKDPRYCAQNKPTTPKLENNK